MLRNDSLDVPTYNATFSVERCHINVIFDNQLIVNIASC